MNICELRTAYQKILSLPLMEYDSMRTSLLSLIRENESDTRKGAVQILEQARKKIDAIDAETERVRGMTFFEKKYADAELIAGIDEVGRGPLAGPVLTAAVIFPRDLIIPMLNDSKQVSKKHREELYDIIMNRAVAVGVGMNSAEVIDEKGIEFANKDAMRQAIRNLGIHHQGRCQVRLHRRGKYYCKGDQRPDDAGNGCKVSHVRLPGQCGLRKRGTY